MLHRAFPRVFLIAHVLRVYISYLFSVAGSPSQCKPAESIQYNVTISRGIMSGHFAYLGEVSNIRQCIELACKKGDGDLAYVLDDRCYWVKCFITCDLFKAPHVESAAARLNWTGKELQTIN